MNNSSALKKNTKLANGKFIIDNLFSDKGGFSLIYSARQIHKVNDDVLGIIKERVLFEEPVIIKELYFKKSCTRKNGESTLIWEEIDNLSFSQIERVKEKTKSEAIKLSQLRNKTDHILHIYSAFEENNTVYIVTKKIESAVDLDSLLFSKNALETSANFISFERRKKYILQVCEALKIIHNNNIIHLDIKPDNILIDGQDNAILIDFGISVSLVDGKPVTILGAATTEYAPPEQLSNKSNLIGYFSDIYALGVTMYKIFTNKLPPHYTEIVGGGEIIQPPSSFNAEISDYLDEVILKCLELKTQDRYQTMDELLYALKGEQDYQTLIIQVKNAEKEKNYEKAIQLLIESEAYIPLSLDLLNLKHALQQNLEKQKGDNEIAKKIEEADQLISENQFSEAIAVLQLLPENDLILEKINFCQNKLKQKQIEILLVDAEHYENQNQWDLALEKYNEAKKLDQSNTVINKKIEAITQKQIDAFELNEIKKQISLFQHNTIDFETLKYRIELYLTNYPHQVEISQLWSNIKLRELKIKEDLRKQNAIKKIKNDINSYKNGNLAYGSLEKAILDFCKNYPDQNVIRHNWLLLKKEKEDVELKQKQQLKQQKDVEEIENKIAQYQTEKISFPTLEHEITQFLEQYPNNETIKDKWTTLKKQEELKIKKDRILATIQSYENGNITFEKLQLQVTAFLEENLWEAEIEQQWQRIQDDYGKTRLQSEEETHQENYNKALKIKESQPEEAKIHLFLIPKESVHYNNAQILLKEIEAATIIVPTDDPYKEADNVPPIDHEDEEKEIETKPISKPQKKKWVWVIAGVAAILVFGFVMIGVFAPEAPSLKANELYKNVEEKPTVENIVEVINFTENATEIDEALLNYNIKDLDKILMDSLKNATPNTITNTLNKLSSANQSIYDDELHQYFKSEFDNVITKTFNPQKTFEAYKKAEINYKKILATQPAVIESYLEEWLTDNRIKLLKQAKTFITGLESLKTIKGTEFCSTVKGGYAKDLFLNRDILNYFNDSKANTANEIISECNLK